MRWLNLRCCGQTHQKFIHPAFSPPSSLSISRARPPTFDHISRHLYHRRASSRHSGEVPLATSPLACLPTHGGPSTSPVASSHQAAQAWRVRGRTHSLPALPSAVYETPVIAPSPQHRVVLSTPQTFEPYTPRHARRQARQNPPIPLSLLFAHIPRA